VTEVVTLQIRRNVGERSNALGLKCVGGFVVEDVGTEKRRHDVLRAMLRVTTFCNAPRHNILHFCARELGAISAAYAATRLEGSIAPRHNILHFCARELGAISAAYAATRLEGSDERESMLGWLIFSSQDARFHAPRHNILHFCALLRVRTFCTFVSENSALGAKLSWQRAHRGMCGSNVVWMSELQLLRC